MRRTGTRLLILAATAIAGGKAMSCSTLLGLSATAPPLRWVLASGSPRRREILTFAGLAPEVVVSGFAEDLDKAAFASAADYAQATATEKARFVASDVPGAAGGAAGGAAAAARALVVGADTVVELDGDVLEKPADEEDAKRMLRVLSGRWQQVHTGVAVFEAGQAQQPLVAFAETTRVKFMDLEDMDIDAYVRTGEPMDKAGAWGIQGYGGQFVERLESDFFNVMGFPLHRFSREMASLLREAP